MKTLLIDCQLFVILQTLSDQGSVKSCFMTPIFYFFGDHLFDDDDDDEEETHLANSPFSQ